MQKASVVVATGLLIAAAGCDTKQPIDAGPQIISVTAQAFSLTQAVRIYDVWEDLDLDGSPDVDTGEKRCVLTGNFVNAPVPWEFSASISIIPAGTTDEIPIRSTVSDSDPFTNLTPYDDQIRQNVSDLPIQGRCVGGPSNGQFCQTDMMCDPNMVGAFCGPRVFHFLDGREVTTSNLDYILNCTEDGPAIGVANILGETGSFDVEVSPGDTIVFRARKQLTADSFPYDQFVALNSLVFLSSTFAIDGNNVTPTGNPNSSGDEGAGYTASVGIR